MPPIKKPAPEIKFTIPKAIWEGTFGLQNLLDKFGDIVEPPLYALICDTKNPLRTTVDKNLKDGTQSAISVLVPLLIAQFALAPAVAALVAGFAVKVIAEKGQSALCAELAERRAMRAKEHQAVEAPKAKRERDRSPVKKKPKSKPAVKRKTR